MTKYVILFKKQVDEEDEDVVPPTPVKVCFRFYYKALKIVFFQWKSPWQYDDCSIFEVTCYFSSNGTNISFFSQEETRRALFKEVDFQVASREVTGSNIIEIVEGEVCLIYILMFCIFRYDWNSSIHSFKIFKFMGKKFSLSLFQFDVIFITARARTRIHTRIWATIRTRPQTRTATRPTTVA